MPLVIKSEFRQVWETLQKDFEIATGTHLHKAESIPDYFRQLEEWLNHKNPYKCNSTYLYKEVYLEKMTRKSGDQFPFNEQMLNCLYYKYSEKTKGTYDEEFRTYNIIRPSKEGIKKIKPSKKLLTISRPEFPPDNPSYPATPHIPMEYKNFKKLWIKNEAYNPTGTHKDRFAWEIVRYYALKYKEYLHAKTKIKEPRLSIISSGSAAIAIQNLLNIYNFPPLKVLYDETHLSESIIFAMQEYGCELYPYPLTTKELSSKDILKETNNGANGIEITLSKELNELRFKFYDWLAFEILNQNPDICIIPFGSGQLYENILEINKNQQKSKKDPRFFGDIKILRNCQFVGASCRYEHKETKMDKLYTQWNTGKTFKFLDYRNYCSVNSRIIEVQDKFIDKAIDFAKFNNIIGEPSGLSSLALFFQLEEEDTLNPEQKILILNTGNLKFNSIRNRKKRKEK
ncbi:MAG: hypothetical protein JWN78_3015 [Bacteroidota bacterium]|nr:hypothetical protein [Bacteroidota bacterium]